MGTLAAAGTLQDGGCWRSLGKRLPTLLAVCRDTCQNAGSEAEVRQHLCRACALLSTILP